MAVATGISTDFLSPFGYHNNSIVMGPAGCRFIDYSRFGVPLTVIVLVLAPPLLIVFWLSVRTWRKARGALQTLALRARRPRV